jgi:hypothetical protein
VPEVLVQAHPRQPPAYQARERGLAGLERLARDGKLAPAQQGWLEDIRNRLACCRLSRPICG